MSKRPEGCTYIPDYVGARAERAWLRAIFAAPWSEALRRRTQHYGYRYDYQVRSASPESYLGPLPNWSLALTKRLQRDVGARHPPDQIIINEYQPGQGISPHIDCLVSFAEPIISLSLLSDIEMEFARGPEVLQTRLAARSALILAGPARSIWSHSIRPRKFDRVDGLRVKRARRLSMTFRWLRKVD